MHTSIEGSIALVTGANRGIGRAITEALLERGASKVYAAARRPAEVADLVESYGERVVPIELDVTDSEQVGASASLANDVQILVNNAGVAAGGGLTDADIVAAARREKLLEEDPLDLRDAAERLERAKKDARAARQQVREAKEEARRRREEREARARDDSEL